MEFRSLFGPLFVWVLIANPKLAVATVVTEGLLYEWPLNEVTGPTAFDSMSGRNLQDHGSPGRGVSGIAGAAYSFDGVDDYLAASPALETFGRADFTLSAWIRSTAPQVKVATILFHQSSAGWFELALSSDGQPYFFAQDYQTNGHISLAGRTALTDGRWHLLSLVRQGNAAYLYADSELVAFGSNNLFATVTGTGGVFIGGKSTTDYYKGAIDDVAIYHRALSAEEIAANVIPEPTSFFLTVIGVCALTITNRRRRDIESASGFGSSDSVSVPGDLCRTSRCASGSTALIQNESPLGRRRDVFAVAA